MNKKNIINMVLIFIAVVYGILGILFGSIHPGNIYHRFTGTALTYSKSIISKSFHKHSRDSDIVLSWEQAKEMSEIKWDSTWIYSLKITGFNNLDTRIKFDSLNIIDINSNNIIFKNSGLKISCEGKNEFNLTIDVKNGFIHPIGPEPFHNNVVDSIAENRFTNKLFGIQLFTSVGEQSLIPKEYIVLQ